MANKRPLVLSEGVIELTASDNLWVAGSIVVDGTVDGRDIATDGTKLDGIESGATGDQTGAEIKSAYESEANTNAFTDAEQSKLAGIAASATAQPSIVDNGDATAITIDVNENVGIGATPSYTLDVLRADSPVIASHANGVDSMAFFKLKNDAREYNLLITGNAGVYGGGDSFVISDETAAAARLTINSSGNVGIGTSSPSARLDSSGHIRTTGSAGEPTTGAGVEIFYASNTGRVIAYDRGLTAYKDLQVEGLNLKLITNGTERLRIDTSGNVGIGTSSPTNGKVEIQQTGTGNTPLWVQTGEVTSATRIADFRTGANISALNIKADGTSEFSGNVGIGTSSPNAHLDVSDTVADDGGDSISLSYKGTSGNHQSKIKFFDYRGQQNAEICNNLTNDGIGVHAADLVFKTATGGTLTERMRIDAAGNTIFKPQGTSDAVIIGGGTNHSIYREGGDGSGFHFSTNGILPANELGTASDATENLGSGSYRFKDLHLSGAVYVGGTAAANALDDYEEGTWTPTLAASGYTFSYGSQVGKYTKIGNRVFVQAYMTVAYSTGSGSVQGTIGTLPFTSSSSTANYSGGSLFPDGGAVFFSRVPSIRTGPSSTALLIGEGFAGGAVVYNFDWSTMGTIEFELSIHYEAA